MIILWPYAEPGVHLLVAWWRHSFHITGPLWGESNFHWTPSQRTSYAELRCFFGVSLNKPLKEKFRGRKTEMSPLQRNAWWRHQIEIFSASLDLCEGNQQVTGGFPLQKPVTRSFNVFFALHLNKRPSDQLGFICSRVHVMPTNCFEIFPTILHFIWDKYL